MANLRVRGGKPLKGLVYPSGNKNSALPILCATLLTDDPVILTNVPDITDVKRLLSFFELIGSRVKFDENTKQLEIVHKTINQDLDPNDIPEGMRSSVLLLAPLLHRLGRVVLHSNTKGCALGAREIDPHLSTLEAFGYRVKADYARIEIDSDAGRIRSTSHWLEYASVTTTENFLMTASLANGRSVLVNAACEPHVQHLCEFLNAMGAKVSGVGSNTLSVNGVESLKGCTYEIPNDHHEIATYLAIGAITHGDVSVSNAAPEQFALIDRTFQKLGVKVTHSQNVSRVSNGDPFLVERPYTENILTKVEAAPWPYFPADLLPPFIALATAASGEVLFWNKVYEGGLTWLPEMGKFGAHFHMSDPHRVVMFGGRRLHPATVEAPYIIRAAIALLMVSLSVEGESIIRSAQSIKRAHPNFVEKLVSLGADVSWENDDDRAAGPAREDKAA